MIRYQRQTILGDIPGDWKARPLRSLLTDELSGDWGDDEGDVTLSVLRSTNFTDSGNLDLADVARRGFSATKAAQIQVQPNDVLVERSGGGPKQPVGRVAMIREAMPETGFANFVQALRPNSFEIAPELLLWMLHQFNRSGLVEKLQHQTTQMRNLDLRDYLKVLLPVPSDTNEQSRIGETLKAADDYIRALEEQICKAERVAVALDQAHFAAGPHTVRFPYEYGTTRTIPHGWPSKRLGKIADVTSGITLNQDREAADNGIRYLTVVNVYRGRIDLTEERYLESRGNESESKRLNRYDILVIEGHANPEEIGRAALVSEREAGMSFQNHLFRVRLETEDEVRARFLVRALNSPRVRRHWVATANTSSGLSTINRTALRRLIVPLPKPEEQDLIVERLEAAEVQVTALNQQLTAARRVKQSLLQNLLTGKVRLNP
jgi:type I restriction enzyme, S subunit